MALHHIKLTYGEDGIADLPKPALFTDDTQINIAIAETLIRADEKYIETIMQVVKDEFLKWYHSPENTRAPGRTCLTGVASMEKDIHWSESGAADSKGCGSAMRAAPIGYFYQTNSERLKQVVRTSGICTHGHPAADSKYLFYLDNSKAMKYQIYNYLYLLGSTWYFFTLYPKTRSVVLRAIAAFLIFPRLLYSAHCTPPRLPSPCDTVIQTVLYCGTKPNMIAPDSKVSEFGFIYKKIKLPTGKLSPIRSRAYTI